MCALLLDYNLDFRECFCLLPVLHANFNCTSVTSLADKAHIEVFLALPASSALDIVQLPQNGTSSLVEVDPADVSGHVDRMRRSLQQLDKEVLDVKEKRLQAMCTSKGRQVNLDVGDYVL